MKAKYWNMIDGVVDTAALLAEDKPVAKAIIGAVDTIVESQANGITNTSVTEVIKSMAKSKWNDIKEADLSAIVDIIGKDVKLDLTTDASAKDTGWLGKLWGILKMILGFAKPLIKNPEIRKIVGYVEALVAAKDAGISNNAVKDTLVAMSKSAWNSLDSDKISKIMAIINKGDK
jgi:hypothetical protein